jgi:hypothetical protein
MGVGKEKASSNSIQPHLMAKKGNGIGNTTIPLIDISP